MKWRIFHAIKLTIYFLGLGLPQVLSALEEVVYISKSNESSAKLVGKNDIATLARIKVKPLRKPKFSLSIMYELIFVGKEGEISKIFYIHPTRKRFDQVWIKGEHDMKSAGVSAEIRSFITKMHETIGKDAHKVDKSILYR